MEGEKIYLRFSLWILCASHFFDLCGRCPKKFRCSRLQGQEFLTAFTRRITLFTLSVSYTEWVSNALPKVTERTFPLLRQGVTAKKAFILVNESSEERTLEISLNGADIALGKVKATDEDHEFDDVEPLEKTVNLPPFAIRYVEFR